MPNYKEFNILILESNIEIEKAYDNLCFSNAYIYTENVDVKKYTDKIIAAYKLFFNKCIEIIKQLYENIKIKLDEIIIQHKLNKLTDFKKSVETAKKQGKTSFKCIDIDKTVALLKDESKQYKAEINSFCYGYIHGRKTPDAALKDIQRIEMKMEKYSNELNELLNTPKTYSIDDAEKIVEKLTKDKEYIEVLHNYTKEIKDIEKYTINVMKSIKNYNEEYGLDEMSGIQEIVTKSILYLRDHTFDIVKRVNEIFGIFSELLNIVNGAAIVFKSQETDLDPIDVYLQGMQKTSEQIKIDPGLRIAYKVGSGAVNRTYGKSKEQQRIEDISKIYNSPSLHFR